jgi:hypothetical protein
MEARTPFASGNAASVLYVTLRLDYFREPKRLLRLIKPDLVGAGCAAMLVLSFAVPCMPTLKKGIMATRSVEESQAFSASVADFFIPFVHHPLFGSWVAQHWRASAK